MSSFFNFLDHPYLVVLSESLKSLPGIERIDLVYYNKETSETNLFRTSRENNSNLEKISLDASLVNVLNAYRRKLSPVSWISISDIPYSKEPEIKLKKDLFYEFESHVLAIAIANDTDFSKDVFLFFFKKNASDFGLSKADQFLSTSNKAIIAHFLLNAVRSQIESIKQNQRNLKLLNQHHAFVADLKDKLEHENRYLKARNIENLTQLTEYFINDLNSKNSDTYYLSEEAKVKLGNYTGSVFELKNKLEVAMILAKNSSFGLNSKEYVLVADYFNFDQKEIDLMDVPKHDYLSAKDTKHTHSKTFDFLNELENATKSVIDKGWKLTSANVAQNFEKPVTAAAISDKLKNHASKIILLLEQYPAKWSIIRNRFKPLQNITIKAKERSISKAS